MRRIARQSEASRDSNALTPMIDIVFLLIVFFMLVAELTRARGVDLELAQLQQSDASRIESLQRLTIHVAPAGSADAAEGTYRFSGKAFGENEPGLASLAGAVRAEAGDREELVVFVRAGRNEAYDRVHGALRAAALAGADRVELVVDGRNVSASGQL